MRYRAKFLTEQSNRSGDMATFGFFKIAAIRHLGFLIRLFGPPT